jgi:hypothetical protein
MSGGVCVRSSAGWWGGRRLMAAHAGGARTSGAASTNSWGAAGTCATYVDNGGVHTCTACAANYQLQNGACVRASAGWSSGH